MSLEALARLWIADYWDAEHLRRTHDWLAVLAPDAPEALRLAALTHDMERHVPGGPVADPDRPPWDRAYRDAHAGRSAMIVAAWLATQPASPAPGELGPRAQAGTGTQPASVATGASGALIEHTAALIRLHEWGGTPEADLLQTADSLSFLEVNGALLAGWVGDGRITADRARSQLRWMADRIRVEAAREPARPLLAAALVLVDDRVGT